MPILSLLLLCIRQAGSTIGTNDPSDPTYEIPLIFIVGALQHESFGDEYLRLLIPRRSHRALLTAARTALEQCRARHPLPQWTTDPRPQPRLWPWIGPGTV